MDWETFHVETVPSCAKAPRLLDGGGWQTRQERAKHWVTDTRGLRLPHRGASRSASAAHCNTSVQVHSSAGGRGPVGECLLGQIVVCNMDWSFSDCELGQRQGKGGGFGQQR